jgi:hypothetical protein
MTSCFGFVAGLAFAAPSAVWASAGAIAGASSERASERERQEREIKVDMGTATIYFGLFCYRIEAKLRCRWHFPLRDDKPVS